MNKLTILSYKYLPNAKLRDVNQRETPESTLMRMTTSGLLYQIWFNVKEMRKDFVDTFKPYKHSHQLYRDKWQSWNGLKVTGLALLGLVFYPVAVFFTFIAAVFSPIEDGPNFLRTLVLFPLESITRLVRGVTLLATSPLTLLRIPLRLLITKFMGIPTIEENPGVRSLVNKAQQAEAAGQSTNLIQSALSSKVRKSAANGQISNIEMVAKVVGDKSKPVDYKLFLVGAATAIKKQDISIEETVTRDETSYMGPPV